MRQEGQSAAHMAENTWDRCAGSNASYRSAYPKYIRTNRLLSGQAGKRRVLRRHRRAEQLRHANQGNHAKCRPTVVEQPRSTSPAATDTLVPDGRTNVLERGPTMIFKTILQTIAVIFGSNTIRQGRDARLASGCKIVWPAPPSRAQRSAARSSPSGAATGFGPAGMPLDSLRRRKDA